MFWNPLKRTKKTEPVAKPEEKPEETIASVLYAIDNDYNINVEVNLKNKSDESIDKLSRLIAGIFSMVFASDTISIIESGLDDKELYKIFLTKASTYTQMELEQSLGPALNELRETHGKSDEPCVKPLDI
jgi:hypothetical protein